MADFDTTSVPFSRSTREFITPQNRYRIYWDDALRPHAETQWEMWASQRTIVYIIRCDAMPVYVGQTNRGIKARLRSHIAEDSYVSILRRWWPDSVWTIVIWAFDSEWEAKRIERRLIWMYIPQCNLKEAGRDYRTGRHPMLETERLKRMHRIRDQWQARYNRRIGDGGARELYDSYLTLPHPEVAELLEVRQREVKPLVSLPRDFTNLILMGVDTMDGSAERRSDWLASASASGK